MQEKIIGIIKEFLQTDVPIGGDSRLHEDLGLSSLQMLMLIANIEETLDCKISWDRLVNVKTVEQLSRAISEA